MTTFPIAHHAQCPLEDAVLGKGLLAQHLKSILDKNKTPYYRLMEAHSQIHGVVGLTPQEARMRFNKEWTTKTRNAVHTHGVHHVVHQWLQGAIAIAAPPPLQPGIQSPPVPHPAAGSAVAGQPPAAPAPLAAGALAAEGAAGGGQSGAVSEHLRHSGGIGKDMRDGKDQLEQNQEDQHNRRRQLVGYALQQGQATVRNLICWLLEQDEDNIHDSDNLVLRQSAAEGAVRSAIEDRALVEAREMYLDMAAWHHKVLIAAAQADDEDNEGEEGG